MGSILSLAVGRDVALPSLDTVVGVKILKVLDLGVSDLLRGLDEITFGIGCSERTIRHVNRAIRAVMFFVASAVIRLELLGS